MSCAGGQIEPVSQVRRSIGSVGSLQCLHHLNKNAEKVELRRHPLLLVAGVEPRHLASVDAGLCNPDAGGASLDLFQYLGSAPNVVIQHVAPSPHPYAAQYSPV